ncbi:MFS transporter [Peribacillus asahii]|uniref:MFS transporter n=1 Tax=Peribacillus asahii TaxID=228899 RepID=A0A3Q9RMZ3_9BACI|nr:MFS transporter [Peribacillus asahii]AZV43243.1 MFS transporter [Peribacillus asahii]USK83318.1 MFS transporter [Peribacillus asahii]
MRTRHHIHYAWIILAVTFIGILAAQGVRYTYGAFMEPWETTFTTNRTTTSAISFISFIVFAIFQPIVGKMIDQYGIKRVFYMSTLIIGFAVLLSFFATELWQMFILYGIVASIGFGGASGVTATVAVTTWFQKKRGLALGINEAGFGAGQMIIVPSSLLLIDAVGWRWTVCIIGLFLICIVSPLLAWLLKSDPFKAGMEPFGYEKNQEEKQEEKPVVQTKSKADRRFWFLLIPFAICGFTTTGLMDTHLIPFAQACGFSAPVTSAAVSTLAAFNVIGTLVSGILADRFNNKNILVVLYFTRAITVAFLVFAASGSGLVLFIEYPILLFIFAISFGLVDFATVAPTVKLLSEYFEGQSVGLLSGWLFMSHQLGSALGSYIPGILFDQTGNYQQSFIMAFVLLVIAGVLSARLPQVTVKRD